LILLPIYRRDGSDILKGKQELTRQVFNETAAWMGHPFFCSWLKRTTATTEADPYGTTNKKSKDNCKWKRLEHLNYVPAVFLLMSFERG
jgi:hypothetical protein